MSTSANRRSARGTNPGPASQQQLAATDRAPPACTTSVGRPAARRACPPPQRGSAWIRHCGQISRLTVDAERPSAIAKDRSDRPATSPLDISSRSAKQAGPSPDRRHDPATGAHMRENAGRRLAKGSADRPQPFTLLPALPQLGALRRAKPDTMILLPHWHCSTTFNLRYVLRSPVESTAINRRW